MARINLVAEDANEPQPLVGAIRERRGGALMILDRALLNSPALAEGWNAMAPTIRNQSSLPPDLLELAICVVGVVNGARVEIAAHLPLWRAAGATPAKVAALQALPTSDDRSAFSDTEQDVIELALQMTRKVEVEERVFARLRPRFNDRQIVDLVGAISFYNMVSRFLVALDLQPD